MTKYYSIEELLDFAVKIEPMVDSSNRTDELPESELLHV